MTAPKILAFAGSLRRDSLNKKLVAFAAEAARKAGAEVTLIDLKDYPLPVYDGDLEAEQGIPAQAVALKRIFLDHQGLLLACPEYNSSITAVLKNTIDWVSRPDGDEAPLACFVGKVATLLAASPGALGGLRGLVTVRSILGNIKVTVLPGQLAVSRAHEAFAEDGSLTDAKQASRVAGLAQELVDVVAKLNA
jgi:NAD(P)H-dependent FMN reductase